ncbi:MAG: hypothetical protein JSW27_21090 [Phycisphaerales bacterium]|nr:MAG: hypothetical protein JSW27_21090 [Phycisphaerales bacterium]
MPLQPRPIAFPLAVIGFFVVSVVGTIVGLAPDTCCKRALVGAIVVYLATSAAVRAINTILTQAMIASQVEKDTPGDNQS